MRWAVILQSLSLVSGGGVDCWLSSRASFDWSWKSTVAYYWAFDPWYNNPDATSTQTCNYCRPGERYGGGHSCSHCREMDMDVYNPPHSSTRPVVMLIHGGSFQVGTRTYDGMPQLAQMMTERGWVVASIDYREFGTHGYTMAVQAACEDAKAGVDYLMGTGAGAYKINVAEFVVCGDSAGGSTTLSLAYSASVRGNRFSLIPTISGIVAISAGYDGRTHCSGGAGTMNPTGCSRGANMTTEIGGVTRTSVLWVAGTLDLVQPWAASVSGWRHGHRQGMNSVIINVTGGGHVPLEPYDVLLPAVGSAAPQHFAQSGNMMGTLAADQNDVAGTTHHPTPPGTADTTTMFTWIANVQRLTCGKRRVTEDLFV